MLNVYRRALESDICKALEKKMVFLSGPRQVGKTTFALQLLGQNFKVLDTIGTPSKVMENHSAYLNWDNPQVPPLVRQKKLPKDEPCLVFDEIHKYAKWRNLIKGLYDTEKSFRKFLITGSAQLDYYRRGGDSLVGRYRHFRLHPFSLLELNPNPTLKDVKKLLQFGGFPEPLFLEDEKEWRIWQRNRLSCVVKEDLRDLELVREISLVEHLVELLPSRVGSPLSIKSLCEDLGVDHKTVERWLQILERLYLCFRVAPLGNSAIRAVKKEQKLYLWDWSSIVDKGARFENLVAMQLLKYCHFIEDTQGYAMDLRYIRDTNKREVDFVVLKEKKPLFAVECKVSEKSVTKSIEYFSKKFPTISKWYQVHLGEESFSRGNLTVTSFLDFCRDLKMP